MNIALEIATKNPFYHSERSRRIITTERSEFTELGSVIYFKDNTVRVLNPYTVLNCCLMSIALGIVTKILFVILSGVEELRQKD